MPPITHCAVLALLPARSGPKSADVEHVQPQLPGIVQRHLQADRQAAGGVPRRLQGVHQPDVPAGDGRQWGREASPWTLHPGRHLRGQVGGWTAIFFLRGSYTEASALPGQGVTPVGFAKGAPVCLRAGTTSPQRDDGGVGGVR